MLTFNMSVSDREVLNNLKDFPVQIMPQQQKMLSNTFIRTFPALNKWSESVIHTSYIVKIWNPEICDVASKVALNIKFYCDLASKIKFKRILIHLPSTEKEWNCLDIGMKRMANIFNHVDKNIKVVFEIPAFVKGFAYNLNEYLDRILTYQCIFNNSFEIVFDTAHLYSNGLEANEMMELINKYKNYVKVIHLNGNIKDKYTSDKHIQIFSDKSKIKNIDNLIKFIAKNGFICISENTTIHETWDKWQEFASRYGFKLIEFNKSLSI